MAVFERFRTDFKDRLGTVGNLTTSTLDNLKDKLNIKELLNEPPKQAQVKANPSYHKSRSTKRSFFESDEAVKRAEQLISQIHPGYFEADFDAVKHETCQLQTEVDQEEIDTVVEKLAAAVEVVSGRLSSHVMKNHDKLIEGINTVSSVEEDLQAAYAGVRAARGTLKAAGDDVQRNISVVTQTRRKQGYLTLMEVCLKLQKAKNLQQSLKKAQEAGDYGEAMMLCVECFQGVESLKDLSVSQELKATVNRLYVETTQKLDSALQNICSDFNPAAYGKVLEGYMLQGLSGKQMAQKVLTCFKDAIHDNCTKVVRSLLLTRPKIAESLANSGLESSFGEMCRNLPLDLLRPCLLKLFEILFDLLSSYYIMMRWHEYGLQQKQLLKSLSGSGSEDDALAAADTTPHAGQEPVQHAEAPAAAEDVQGGAAGRPAAAGSHPESTTGSTAADRSSTKPTSHKEEVLTQAEIATRSFLTSVHEMLSSSTEEMWDAAAWRIKELLNTIPFKGEDFIQVVEWCQKFLAAGEAFIGKEAELRETVVGTCGRFFAAYHSSNLESLHMCLSTEHWKQIGSNGGKSSMLDGAIRGSPLYVPSFNVAGAQQDFEEWLVKGNPFKRAEEIKQKRRNKQLQTDILRARSHNSFGSKSDPGLSDDDPGSEGAMDSPQSTTSTAAESPFEDEARQGNPTSPLAETSGRPEPTGPARMLTISSQQILKWIKSYGELMRPLPGVSTSIFHGITDLFDAYLLATFLMFSGISLEQLVWKEDVITLRLRSTLLRILMADSSYSQQVEELQRTKPAKTSIAEAGMPSFNLNSKFIDNLDQPFKNFASKLKDHKLIDAFNAPGASKGAAAAGQDYAPPLSRNSTSSSGPAAAASVVASGNLFGLRERVVAVDSLLHIADEIKTARPSLQAALPPKLARELDSYFARTVDATQDLRDCIFRGGARLLLTQGMLDPERGCAAQVAATNYAGKEPATSYSPWTEALKKEYSTFRDLLDSANLPKPIAAQMWEQAIAAAAECILEGLARAKRCTIEGRSAMSLDLSNVEKTLRGVAPQHVNISLRVVDNYIKAFYLPWEELPHWAQIHMPEYGKDKVLVLIECIADTFKIKRQQKRELLAQIDAEMAEFA